MANRPHDAPRAPHASEQAREEELRYRRFLDGLQASGLRSAERAEHAAVAVLSTVELCLSGPERGDLNAELPSALRELLGRSEPAPRGRPARLDRDELLARVGEQLAVDPAESERVARAVLQHARALLSEREGAAVAAQLPPDLQDLWALPA